MKAVFCLIMLLTTSLISFSSRTELEKLDSVYPLCFFNVEYIGKYYIYSDSIMTDSLALELTCDQNYYIYLTGKHNHMWKCIVADPLEEKVLGEFWINSLNGNLQVLSRSNNPYRLPLILFKKPDYDMTKSEFIYEYLGELQVVDFIGQWLRVKFKIKDSDNKIYDGWLLKSMQCGEPYNSCCG